jgi:hypothetical protein
MGNNDSGARREHRHPVRAPHSITSTTRIFDKEVAQWLRAYKKKPMIG